MGSDAMTAATTQDQVEDTRSEDERPDEPLALVADPVEVRRHAGTAAAVGLTAAAVGIAYFARAAQTGALLDWLLAVVMGALGAYWLAGFVDARTPLLVLDAQGVRMRLGRRWHGLPWSAVHHLEHTPRRGPLRDGRLVVVPHNEELLFSGLDRLGRWQAKVSRRLHGSAFALPLGLSTKVTGAHAGLTAALSAIAHDRCDVVQVEASARPTEAAGTASEPGVEAPEQGELADEPGPVPPEPEIVASATPVPLRDSSAGRRSEVHRQVEAPEDADAPEAEQGRELRRPGSVSLVEETQAWGDRVRPIARAGESVEPLVIDEFEIEPAEDPVIGPEVAAARTRLGLTIDQLADRTRIRPHVIESIEVDDFEPCGGDFYARGHLRTLARILGVDAAPLLESYDERYARAPINPRRVFEAELATGAHGSIRGTRGGPNWSLLVAVVMALVLCWSVARLVMDTPAELRSETPVLNGSGGPDGVGSAPLADPVPVKVAAVAGGAHVVVRDGAGEIVFKGNLAAGETKDLDASPPVRVDSTDGALTVSLDGGEAKPVGEPGIAGQGTFVAH